MPNWYVEMNKWCDQVGIAHLEDPKSDTLKPLCGKKVYTLGGGFSDPLEANCHPCPSCLKKLDKLKKSI